MIAFKEANYIKCTQIHLVLPSSNQHPQLLLVQADLEAKENQLDDLIRNAELQLKLLNEDKTNAYVTYQDLRSVPRFKKQTVMAIKAPPEAKLQVPHPSEVKFWHDLNSYFYLKQLGTLVGVLPVKILNVGQYIYYLPCQPAFVEIWNKIK